MRNFLIILIISLFIGSKSNANIKEYQLEGMSVGDSLLLYFDEKKIKRAKRYDHKNTNWKSDKMFQLRIKNVGPYTEVLFGLKKNDPEYIIYSISGMIKMEFNISECYPMLKETTLEFKNQFPNAILREVERPHSGDKSGKSMTTSSEFKLKTGDMIIASCYDWTKKMKYWDNYRIILRSKEFESWLRSAYR
tara:strand:- start:111 stop:686 length:576 start_codon:yes stop_codon:yes gene_type:complete